MQERISKANVNDIDVCIWEINSSSQKKAGKTR